ncbi:MAG: hypothetical protein ACW98D_17005 [Promethearchaeota archaeon]|jgi:hypothetical protein
MVVESEFSRNQEIILNVLKRNDRSMLLLDLKKETKLANLYFFKALSELEEKKKVQKRVVETSTMISLLE